MPLQAFRIMSNNKRTVCLKHMILCIIDMRENAPQFYIEESPEHTYLPLCCICQENMLGQNDGNIETHLESQQRWSLLFDE